MSETILVTGGTGYVSNWVILYALERGYKVKTSLRSLSKEAQLRESLVLSSDKLTKELVDKNLDVFVADLVSDDGWAEAFPGVDYVLHIASPFPAVQPKNPDDIIIPAVEGTLKILRFAASTPTVKQVVVTSSMAAIAYGHGEHPEPFTEKDWSNKDNLTSAYILSKTLAEEGAWKYVKENNVKYALTVMNPAYIFGPTLKKGTGFPASLELIQKLVDGTNKDGAASMFLSYVDVRDISTLHLDALTNPKAKGERFLVNTGVNISLLEIADILREVLPAEKAKNLPTKELEGKKDDRRPSDVTKARTTFGWAPISPKETFLATVNSLPQ
ncbi:hypothetical protein G9P44_001976 [Scheffersomyces stipitis]|nr:hypothetical protein G9P44_001976 [Scheffersomyces stipitis]